MKIELKNISKSFGDKHVLENVSMTFGAGITCVMGASGRGKTTLANIIAGIIPQDSGEIVVTGDVDTLRTSVVFQEDRLLDWETALGNLLFVTHPARKYIDRANDLLIKAGLEDSINKKASKLSGGMRRRVCLCRALIAEYDLLILDEPFKGLDNELKPSIMDMVIDAAEPSCNAIIICITHDESEAKYLGGKIIEI